MTRKHRQHICCGFILLVVMRSASLAAGAETINYAYDPMGRVTRTESDAAAVWVYAYDTMGNRVTRTTTGSPLEVGVVAVYPFSEGSGPTTADASGHGHDGTITGATWTTDGKVGNALGFDGVDDVVEVTDASLLRLGTTQTIAGWVNLMQLPSDWVRVIGKGDVSYRNYGVWVGPSGEVLYQIVSSGGVWSDIFSTTSLSPGLWYHLAATYDGTTVRLYINGQEEASEAYTHTPSVSSDPLTFGYAGYHTYLHGKLDEVKIYDRALSASEIQDLVGVIADDTVASYPFSEGSGNTTADASGNGLDGTLLNGVSWTTDGKAGHALDFDGVDDVVEVADVSLLRLGTTQTIAGWVNLTQLPADWVRVIGKGDVSYRNYGVWVGPSGEVLYQIVSSGGVWSDIFSTTSLSPGLWYHLAATYDGTTVRLYINGQEEVSEAYTHTPAVSSDPLTFGYAGYHTYLHGKLDEVKIYDRALSASEIQDLVGVIADDTVASYPFSEGSGNTTADASGNGLDGTLLNGVSWTTDGKAGHALDFDGVDDVVEVADASLLRLGTTQTIAGWVNLTQLPADWVRVIGKGDVSYRNYGVWVGPSGEVLYQIVSSGGVWSDISSTTSLSPGLWYHLAATYDGTTVRLYINGQEEVSEAYTHTPAVSADPLTFGYAGYHTYLHGKLDEVKIYDRALSATEIQVLAGVGGESLFAATSVSENSVPLSTRVDDLVEVDGSSISINVGESPELNYGIGDFTVVVTARTADASSVYKETPPWPPSRGEYIPQISSREEFTGSVSHVAVGVRQGKDLFLYLDGALQAQKSVGDGRITRLNVNVGLDDVSTHAIIEDVKLYPSALSPEEIAGLSAESELK